MLSSAKHLKFICKFVFVPAALSTGSGALCVWLFAGWQSKGITAVLSRNYPLCFTILLTHYIRARLCIPVWNSIIGVITSTSGAFLEFYRYLHLNLSTHWLDLIFTREHQWELRAWMTAHVWGTWRECVALTGWTVGWFIFTVFGFRCLSSISLLICWKFSTEQAFCGGICTYMKTLGKVNIFHNHRIDPVGRDFKYHLIPSHLTLHQFAQSNIQPVFEHIQGWIIHNFIHTNTGKCACA